MDNSNVLIIGIIFYFAINLIIGLFGFKNMSYSEIATAQNQTNTFKLTITLLGTIIGGGMFLGIAEMGYNGGLAFIGLGLIYLFGSFCLGLMSPFIRDFISKKQVTNLFDLLDKIYPSSNNFSVKNIFAFCSLLVYFIMLAAQFVGIAIFYSYFTNTAFSHNSLIIAAGISTLTTIIYSTFGGFKKDIVTDIIQFVFIFIGLTCLFAFGSFSKSILSTIQNLPVSDLSLKDKYNYIYLIGALLFVAPTFFARYDIWQRIITAKDNKVARNSFFISGILAFIAFCIFGFIGLYGKSENIQNDKFVALEVLNLKLTGFPLLFSMLAFFAAVMSSADTFLGSASLSLTTLLKTETDEKRKKIKYRISSIFIGLLSVFITLFSSDIIELFSVAFGILMVFLPAIFGAMFRKEPKENEALWSIYIGLGVFFISFWFFPKEAFIPSVLASIITYEIVKRQK
jgi:SSS family solute:Na+ symporter